MSADLQVDTDALRSAREPAPSMRRPVTGCTTPMHSRPCPMERWGGHRSDGRPRPESSNGPPRHSSWPTGWRGRPTNSRPGCWPQPPFSTRSNSRNGSARECGAPHQHLGRLVRHTRSRADGGRPARHAAPAELAVRMGASGETARRIGHATGDAADAVGLDRVGLEQPRAKGRRRGARRAPPVTARRYWPRLRPPANGPLSALESVIAAVRAGYARADAVIAGQGLLADGSAARMAAGRRARRRSPPGRTGRRRRRSGRYRHRLASSGDHGALRAERRARRRSTGAARFGARLGGHGVREHS